MSVNPVLAAVVGLLGLGQNLGWTEWASIGAVVAANSAGILAGRHCRRAPLGRRS